MKHVIKGYKFKVCSCDELIKRGWIYIYNYYTHPDFLGGIILREMIDANDGKILTVTNFSTIGWYIVKENNWIWPVVTFLKETELTHLNCECEKGMTPIDGWIICKHCGNNLSLVK